MAAGHVPRNVSLTPKSDEDALNKRGARISVFINMAARFMPRVGPSRETSEEGEREKGAATRWSATMLFGQRLLPLYSIVASKGPKRRMKRRRESASVQTYSSPREYKVNRPPLQCSGTNLAFLSLSPSSSSTETAFCALLSSALALFLPLPLSSPERSHQPFFFSFLSSFFLSHPLLSLSLSPFLFLSFLFFFYAAHQSFLLAFLFSLLASRPFSRRARMHARTHACTTRLCNRVYSSMTPHTSSHRVLAQRFPLKHRSERNATRLVSNRISFTIFNLLSKEG